MFQKIKPYLLPMILITIIMSFLFFSNNTFAADMSEQFKKVDAGGQKIVDILQKVAFWIYVIKGMFDFIKAAMDGDKSAMGRIFMFYVGLYVALQALPWALRLTDGIF